MRGKTQKTDPSNRVCVGLTGGIGAGKSLVCRAFASWGAHVLNVDALAKAVYHQKETQAKLREAFLGASEKKSLSSDEFRRMLREALGKSQEAQRTLERIIYPQLGIKTNAWLAAHPSGVLVLDVPLLLERDFFRRLVDWVVVVVAPKEARIQRVMARDGVSQANIEGIMQKQIDPNTARMQADFVIENDQDTAHALSQARHIFDAVQNQLKGG